MTSTVPQVFADGKGTLTTPGEEMVINGLVVLQDAIKANNFEKGWRSEDSPQRNVGELCMLIDSETAEAFEAYRNNEPNLWFEYNDSGEKTGPTDYYADSPVRDHVINGKELGKPQGMAAELADVIIRVLDMADELDIPVIDAVLFKHKYNQTRSYRHGGKKA